MKKVITYGTFDLFHVGHYNILKRAKEAGDYLIVGVTGENYDAERGKLSVQDSLSKRIENVKKTGFADQIIVEEYLGQKISDIIKYNIDILVIGSDWRGEFDHLNKYCEVRYLERTKDISSTQIREEKLDIYKFGIVTDSLYDNEAVMESKKVSGIHVESVFSENRAIAKDFAEKYELDNGYTDYKKFLKNVDIVYIKTLRKDRKRFVEYALKSKKHVICDVPITLSIEENKKLINLAKSQNVILLDNMSTMFLQSFGQLSWMVRGNLIGDIVSIKCSISKNNFNRIDNKDIFDIAYYPVCIVVKLLGNQFKDCNCKIIKTDKDILYGTVELIYEKTIAIIEIGMDISVEDGIVITGTKGTIFVPDNWWNLGYFKVKKADENKFKRYSYNFDGNGFRYIMQSLLYMIKNKSGSSQRITEEECNTIIHILNTIGSKVGNDEG